MQMVRRGRACRRRDHGAATLVTSAENEETAVRASAVEDTAARAWNLDDTDWARYQTLTAGRCGVWSDDADPVLVLGAHARTTAERRRFGEAYVAAEKARGDDELAFEAERARRQRIVTRMTLRNGVGTLAARGLMPGLRRGAIRSAPES